MYPKWDVLSSVNFRMLGCWDVGEAFKTAFANMVRLSATGTALRSAAALGFGRAEIVATIQSMQRGHFYKSMTAYANHRLWQDVYHPDIFYVRVSEKNKCARLRRILVRMQHSRRTKGQAR